MQGPWPAGPPALMAYAWLAPLAGLGPPTTAAQNLAELLLITCGCRYVIVIGARFKSSVETTGGRLGTSEPMVNVRDGDGAVQSGSRDAVHIALVS